MTPDCISGSTAIRDSYTPSLALVQILQQITRECSNHCRDTWIKKHRVVPTLNDFCENRVKSYARATYERSSPKTYRWYVFGIAVLTTTQLAHLRLDEIGTEQIAQLLSELQERKKTARGKEGNLQLSTINSCLRALRRVLRLAAEWQVIDTAPKVKNAVRGASQGTSHHCRRRSQVCGRRKPTPA